MDRIDSLLVSIYNRLEIFILDDGTYIFAVNGLDSNQNHATFKVSVPTKSELDDLIDQAKILPKVVTSA